MKIYYTGVDCGDGSITVRFFESQECIALMEEFDPESYRGEGGSCFSCDNFTGTIITLEDVEAEIKEYKSWLETM